MGSLSKAGEPSTPERPSFDCSESTQLDLSPRTLSYISSLPTHLRPSSPYLAALHDARLTLLNIPYAKSPIRWCSSCGALRDFASSPPPPIEPELSAVTVGSSRRSKGSPLPLTSPAKARTSKCLGCGKPFRRAKKAPADSETLRTFRPARTIRKERGLRATASMTDIDASIQSAGVVDVFMDDSADSSRGLSLAQVPISGTLPLDASSVPLPNLGEPSRSTQTPADSSIAAAAPPIELAQPAPAPYHMPLASPSLRYIPTTAPTPPSYIQPPAVRPVSTNPGASPAGSSSGRTSDITKTDSDGARRKKKKSSGLAKLLAQSKEREEGAAGGKWGFG